MVTYPYKDVKGNQLCQMSLNESVTTDVPYNIQDGMDLR
jgi:hypothetical protein